MEHYADFSMQDAMRLAGTPAGQQLLALLQQRGGQDLQIAMEQAAVGNMMQVKDTLSALLSDPQVKTLLTQLGGDQ